MIPCSWKQNLGIECPGCGFQRSFFKLLEGEVYESLMLFPAVIPLILLFIFLCLHLKFKFKNGASILVSIFSFNILLILVNFIYKSIL